MDMQDWMERFRNTVLKIFGRRIVCIGLQGSRGRGEATETSDIDAVVILDRLDADDLHAYGRAVSALPYRALLCGFISGRAELENWDTADLFQFYFDTEPVYGDLEFLRARIDDTAAERAVRMGACNLYHGCAHNMLHEKSGEVLAALLKSAVFTVQAAYYRRNGVYIRRHSELAKAVSGTERELVEAALRTRTGIQPDFDVYSALLFTWAGALIRNP